MAGKKKKVKDELAEQFGSGVDEDLLTDEEKALLDTDIEDEPNTGGDGDDEPGEEGDDKKGDEEGDKKGGGKDEGKDDEGPKPGDKGGDEGDDKGDDKGDALKDSVPVTIEVDGEKIEGFVAKSGKYIIPYSEVTKRDEARRTLRATTEVQEGQIKALKAQVEALNERLKSGQAQGLPEGAQATDQLDFKALGKKLYQSDEDAAEVLEQLWNSGFKAGKAVAGAPTGEQGGAEAAPQILTTEQQAAQIKAKADFQAGVEKVLEQYPQLKNKDAEYICYQLGMDLLGERLHGLDEAAQAAWCQVPENLLGLLEEAATKTVAMVRGPEPSSEERAAEDKKREDALFEKVVTRLKLTPEDVRTLGDIRGAGVNQGDPHQELDEKSPAELEEAMADMSEEEREAYLDAPFKTK